MKIAEAKFYLQENPFVLPLLGLVVALVVASPFIFRYHADSEYSELTGVVCCLSENQIVYSAKFNDVAKLMYVEIGNGVKVEVPIRDIPYIAGKEVLLRKRSKPDIYGVQYQAISYR